MEQGKTRKIRYLIIDVDGTMTDAGIYYDDHGNELKKFCTKDAAGFFAARQARIKIMVLTGRECPAVTKRMNELKVDYLNQNIKDKRSFLERFMHDMSIQKEEVAYIGDDLNDLDAMQLAGFVGCPKDACEEVIQRADYVSYLKGGCGAVRDVIMYLLKARGEWENAVSEIYGIGV